MYQLNDRINNLKNTIALSCADLRGCSTRAQVQSINSFIASRKAELVAAGLACEIAPEEIPEAYMGTWETDEEMAMEQWEEGGMLESVPSSVRAYIDWESVARDMRLNGEFREAGEHYFRAC